MPKNLKQTLSATSENKENSDVSPMHASPKSDSVSAQLERKTKEAETARKLVDAMKLNREKDQAAIAELRQSVAAAEIAATSKTSELETEIESLKSALADAESEIVDRRAALDDLSDAKQREIDSLSSQLSFADYKLESLKAEYDAKIEAAKRDLNSAESGKASVATELQQKLESMQQSVAERDAQLARLQTELETLNQRIASTTAELDNLRTRKGQDESRMQSELKKLGDQLDKAMEENGSLKWQLDNEKQLSGQKLADAEGSMRKAVAKAESEAKELGAKASKLEREIEAVRKADGDKAKELEAGKHDAVRKQRIAESKAIEGEEAIAALIKKLKAAEEVESMLREEVESLVQQQSSAIEKISGSNLQRDIADRAAKESADKSKQMSTRVNQLEKQLKATEETVSALKHEIELKKAAVADAEMASVKAIEAEKKKTQNVAIITSVAVLVLSRIIFA